MAGADHHETRPVRDGITIGVATGLVGAVFGVLATTSGQSVAQACVMSLLVFTGASQFAATSIVADGGSLAAALGTGLMLAARNALYGPLVARWFAASPWVQRALLAQIVIDESTALGAAQPTAAPARRGFLAAGVAIYVCWNVGTLVGAVAGDAIGDAEHLGLDAAFPAAFVVLLTPHLRRRPGRIAAVSAAVLAVSALPLVPTGVPILVAALGALPAAWFVDREEAA